MHYLRWKRHGDPLYTLPVTSGCPVDGCGRPSKSKRSAHGWCQKHYERWRAHGDPGVTLRPGAGWVKDGYRAIKAPDHPMATADGSILEHRLVLFDLLGPGEQECHWCSTTVTWSESWPVSRRALVVDHLDFDGLNNDPANLVPSCHPCNAGRTRRWEDDHAAPAKAS